MAKRSTSAKPVCQACNRPFDPRSAGATPQMGPTCAKRAGAALAVLNLGQLGFEIEIEDSADRSVPAPPAAAPKISPRQIPKRFDERFVDAKIAFDELYREFIQSAPLVQGADAEALDIHLANRPGVVTHSLRDPTLPWLEPEHDLALVIEASGRVYHRRALNGVLTLLEIDPSASPEAWHHVEVIASFTRALREHRLELAAVQPSLGECGA